MAVFENLHSVRLAGRSLLCLCLCLGFLGSPAAFALETVVLIPEDRADWRPSSLFAFLRAGHNFNERAVVVETSPEGAGLDLFYVRSNFQKRYEQAESPARVLLPRRVDAGPRDSVTIRAFLEGYRQKEVSIRVQSKQDRVVIELDPLPNQLVAASHVYLAGRADLVFLTKEALSLRVQEGEDNFNVILAETAQDSAVATSVASFESPLVEGVEALQLGEDLLVRVRTRPGVKAGYELRSRQTRDELRDLYRYSVELVPADGGVEAVQRARSALARLGPADVTGCASRLDKVLRDGLEPAALSRALSPRGAFTDPYLRAAMKRLGELSPGQQIAMLDGTVYSGGSQLELAAAMSQPADARGLLALLHAFVVQLEPGPYQAATFGGLIAPEEPPEKFEALLVEATVAASSCRAGTSASRGS